MARKRGKPGVSGWLVLDKPIGLSSAQAVSRIKKLFSLQKIGHAGTLDPLASGVLPLAFEEATKAASFLLGAQKSYRFTTRWGVETDTLDAEGQVVATSAVRPTRAQITAVIPRFLGEISQIPPRFSALKINGARAYALARAGADFEIRPRSAHIFSLRLCETEEEAATFEVSCGKGTYVRSLSRDLAHALGACGNVVALRRTRVGPFSEDQAVSVEAAAEKIENATAASLIAPVETVFTDLTRWEVDSAVAARLTQGQAVSARVNDVSGLAYVVSNSQLVAIARIEGGLVQPQRIFHIAKEA